MSIITEKKYFRMSQVTVVMNIGFKDIMLKKTRCL